MEMKARCLMFLFTFFFALVLSVQYLTPDVFAANYQAAPAKGLMSIKGVKTLNIFTSVDNFAFDINLQSATNVDSYVNWTVKNYFGEIIKSETSIIRIKQQKITVDLGRLETGHYVVETNVSGEKISDNFAVVMPYEERLQYSNPSFDSPFATDTAFSWYREVGAVTPFSDRLAIINAYARAVKLSGVTWIRERMAWDAVSAPEGKFQHDIYIKHYHGNRKLIDTSYSTKRLVSLIGTPKNAIRSENRALGNKLPDDISKIYDFAKEYGKYYKDEISMWEIWNEPEAHETGPGEGADKYAATLKAASIGFHDAGIPVTVGGLLTRDARGDYNISSADVQKPIRDVNNNRLYQDNFFENGIIDYLEIYNFHNHRNNIDINQEPPKLIHHNTGYNRHMFSVIKNQAHIEKKNSLNGGVEIPAWVTEAGGAIANSPNGLDTYEKQQVQARYLVTSAVLSLSTGVDKHFWFFGRGVVENHGLYKNVYWGYFSPFNPLTRQLTPYAAYAAQAAMTDALGEAKYLGKVPNLPVDAEGYVFKDGKDTVLALWANGAVTASLSLQKPKATKIDIMGRKKAVSSSNGIFVLSLGSDPIYLRVAGDIPEGFGGVYTASSHKRKTPMLKTLTSAKRIVLDQTFLPKSRSHFVKSSNGYFIQPNVPITVYVTVYNFNNMRITGTVTGSFDSNDYIVSESQNVTVEPNGQRELTYVVMGKGDFNPDEAAAKLTFTGNFNIGQTTPSVAKVKKGLLSTDKLEKPDYIDPCGDTRNWKTYNDDLTKGHNWKVVAGKLVHDKAKPSSLYAYLIGTEKMTDGIVSAKFTIGKHGTNDFWAGLGIRRNISGDMWHSGGYLVFIRPDGKLSIFKGGNKSTIIGNSVQTRANMINNDDDVELTVVMKGARFDIYVNRAWVHWFEDETYKSGYVGPVAKDAKVYFNDFKAVQF